MNTEKPYKVYQKIYQHLVTENPDDFKNLEIVEAEELVENALHYFAGAEFPLIYPAKSYATAVIYATLIEQHYGYPLRETLDDPDLFLGQDEYFVPYSQNPAVYEALLERLSGIENWLDKGWAPYTAKYFHLECTEEGINQVMSEMQG